MNAYTKDMAIIFLLQLDVANTLRIRTLGNCMLMIVDKFVAINSDTGKRLEEGIVRSVTYTNYTLFSPATAISPSKRLWMLPSASLSSVKR